MRYVGISAAVTMVGGLLLLGGVKFPIALAVCMAMSVVLGVLATPRKH